MGQSPEQTADISATIAGAKLPGSEITSCKLEAGRDA